jgi:hypothetical protein
MTTLIRVAVPVICRVRQVILSTSGSPLISNLPAWIIPSPMTDNAGTHPVYKISWRFTDGYQQPRNAY